MDVHERSPRIVRFSWGRIDVEGGRAFKDVKLYPGGAGEWDWTESRTSHSHGIQPADVAEIVERGAEVVILSQGVNRALKVSPQTIELLDERHVSYHVLPTEEAVRLYNELCGKQAVGGLFHSTC